MYDPLVLGSKWLVVFFFSRNQAGGQIVLNACFFLPTPRARVLRVVVILGFQNSTLAVRLVRKDLVVIGRM